MEYRARYALIGAFSLLSLLAAFSFVYWIENIGGLGQRLIYDLHFDQSVSGLAPGAWAGSLGRSFQSISSAIRPRWGESSPPSPSLYSRLS
jgi:hypothetical protein